MRTCLLFLLLFCLILPTPSRADEPEDLEKLDGYRIRKINLVRRNVFDLSNPDESGTVGRVGNAIHSVTQEKVIRNELLFREGDLLNPEKIAESERNLRRYDFLTKIRIRAVPDHENKTVDITVFTQDQWSLIIGGTFGGTNDDPVVGLDIGEKNLLGTGKTVKYQMRSSNAGVSNGFGYRDDTIFDTHYQLEMDYQVKGNEFNTVGRLQKPYFSLDTATSQGVSVKREEKRHATEGYKVDRSRVFYGGFVGLKGGDILRPKVAYSWGVQFLSREGNNPPTVRENKLLVGFQLLLNPHSYEKETYMDKFRIVEDIFMGWNIAVMGGYRNLVVGHAKAEHDNTFESYVVKNFKVFTTDYVKLEGSANINDDSFSERDNQGAITYYYRRLEGHTVVANLNYRERVNSNGKLSLGGANGLRGFKTDEFEGQKMFYANLEDRIFTYKSIFYGIFEPGFVFFTDWGNVWDHGGVKEALKMKASFGAGLRIALLKAPGVGLIRVDLGVPILGGRRTPTVTIGMESFF